MDLEGIVKQLRDEQARIEKAILALSGGSNGKRTTRAATTTGRVKRSISNAERARRSKSQKARWAVIKAKQKKTE